MAKVETLALTQYVKKFFVREKLDEGRIQMFERAYTSRAPVPELVVGKIRGDETDTLYLVDGRTRDAALNRLGRVKIDCEVNVYDSFAEMMADALQRNFGGSLPPTDGDIQHVVRVLVESGTTLTAMCGLLAYVGPKLVRDLYTQAEKTNSGGQHAEGSDGGGVGYGSIGCGYQIRGAEGQIAAPARWRQQGASEVGHWADYAPHFQSVQRDGTLHYPNPRRGVEDVPVG